MIGDIHKGRKASTGGVYRVATRYTLGVKMKWKVTVVAKVVHRKPTVLVPSTCCSMDGAYSRGQNILRAELALRLEHRLDQSPRPTQNQRFYFNCKTGITG